MLYVREIAEKFLIVTDVYIFTLHYLNARRDKEFYIAIHMILEHVLVQRSKKIEMDEKSNF